MFTTVFIGSSTTCLGGNAPGDASGVSSEMNIVIFSGTSDGRALSRHWPRWARR